MSQKLTNAYSIYQYLRKVVFPGHWFLLFVTSSFGAASRVLALTGFALTLKTFMVAIDPDRTLNLVNGVLARINTSFTETELLWAMVAMVFGIYSVNFLIQLGGLSMLGRLTKSILNKSVPAQETIDYRYDAFVVDLVQPAIVGVVKMSEIILFSLMCLLIIATFFPLLLLLLLPLLVLFALILVFNGRHRLRVKQEQKVARQVYVDGTEKMQDDQAGAHHEWATRSRPAYITARFAAFRYAQSISNVGAFLTGVTAILVIIYLAIMNVDKSQFWGPAILLVLAIRQLVAYAREFATQATNVLDLRTNVALMKRSEPDPVGD